MDRAYSLETLTHFARSDIGSILFSVPVDSRDDLTVRWQLQIGQIFALQSMQWHFEKLQRLQCTAAEK